MSRSQPTNTLVNPAKKYLDWDSENGQFKYYNKETKENVAVKLPVKFYVLDELATVKGFSDKHQGGMWSNEVKNITTQKLKVQGKGKDGKLFQVAEGLYSEIKDALVAAGGKYTRSLYVAMLNNEEEYEIVNFQLKGAAFSGWLDFCNENKGAVMTDEITCKDFKREKKGATKYTIPVFTSETASEEGNEAAIKLDIELQEYLSKYFEKTQSTVEYVNDKVPVEEDTEELPF
jgi:hypothetical protein